MVDSYEDHAEGRLGKNERGRIAMLQVTLRPAAQFNSGHAPTPQSIADLHHQAHEHCFIANSVQTQIRIDPVG